jgi:hypothetical protein
LFRGDYADLDKCPKCGCDRCRRKKDGGDDNNADEKNEHVETTCKKKKANRGPPMRVVWDFCTIFSAEKMVHTTKAGATLALA